VEVLEGDVLDPVSLDRALEGVDRAVYLVHSMGSGADFAEVDRKAALAFGDAARRAGVRTIVYLGGLGDEDDDLSPHLRSRHEVGRALAEGGVPVTELRASVILGAGSLSFELIRSLVERLPVMVTPRWVDSAAQPIWIGDVVETLLWALRRDAHGHEVFDIGGPDVVSYGELMGEYARQRGLTRVMIPVPVLTPRLSSLWLGLVTPLYARVGRALIDSVRHDTVVRPEHAPRQLPMRALGVSDAIARALSDEDEERRLGRWADASWLAAGESKTAPRFGNRIEDTRTVRTSADPARAFAAIERIGGGTGWYGFTSLWRVRGWLDLLAGGVGMRRGRRDPLRLAVGDVVDCWRVEAVEHGRRLLLRAEMKLPGRAWLEFVVTPAPGGGSTVRQSAVFDPLGVGGLGYWYALAPLHAIVFAGMLRGIARWAESHGHAATAVGVGGARA
jgi:uncharacterized protein YbjT (DUF2867 family)